jgi:hypothetical protein
MIKEKEWKKSSKKIPLEYHIELMHYAYEVENDTIFDDLAKTAVIRCEHRRTELPYISDIEFVPHNTPFPNISNGYEKIPVDINEADLRM